MVLQNVIKVYYDLNYGAQGLSQRCNDFSWAISLHLM